MRDKYGKNVDNIIDQEIFNYINSHSASLLNLNHSIDKKNNGSHMM